jgi:hypothetical protein
MWPATEEEARELESRAAAMLADETGSVRAQPTAGLASTEAPPIALGVAEA